MSWDRVFDDPIPLHDSRELLTLRDAAEYVQALPKAKQKREEWQRAVPDLRIAAKNYAGWLPRPALPRAVGRSG